jgi:hypothetical protein
MKKLRDFKCDDCGHKFEAFMDDSVKELITTNRIDFYCEKECGGKAMLIASAVWHFQNTTGKSPSASNKK